MPLRIAVAFPRIYFLSARKLSALALVLLLSFCNPCAQAQRDRYLRNPPDMSLKRFAAWLRTISKSVEAKAKSGGSTGVEAAQLGNLYQILNTLQRKRGEYIESIHYLVEAREQHLSPDAAKIRSEAVNKNADEMYQELKILDDAAAPLQLNLDLNHPNVVHFKIYQQRQEAQVKQMKEPEMVGTFTTKDLETIEKDARKNGEVLKQAIDELAATLKTLNSSGGGCDGRS